MCVGNEVGREPGRMGYGFHAPVSIRVNGIEAGMNGEMDQIGSIQLGCSSQA
jgi:hypothetical protein